MSFGSRPLDRIFTFVSTFWKRGRGFLSRQFEYSIVATGILGALAIVLITYKGWIAPWTVFTLCEAMLKGVYSYHSER